MNDFKKEELESLRYGLLCEGNLKNKNLYDKLNFMIHSYAYENTSDKNQISVLSPRQLWLKERVKQIILSLSKLESLNNFGVYKELLLELAKELNYTTDELEKYYKYEL